MSNFTLFKNTGYVEDHNGFSGAFSWWVSKEVPGRWLVVGHGEFAKSGYAVTDDFGSLVAVPE